MRHILKQQRYWLLCVLLSLNDEVVCVVPVSQQVRGLFVVHTHIVVTKSPWEKVVDLPSDIEDVAHTKNKTLKC